MSSRIAVWVAVFLACLCTVTSAAGDEAARRDLYGDPLPAGALLRLGTVRMRHGGIIRAAAFSPDGKLVVTADGQLKAWETATGELRWQANVRSTFGYPSLAFSPDGLTLAAAGHDEPIVFLDAHTGETKQRLTNTQTGRHNANSAVAYSPDGTSLWTCQRDGILRRYELEPDGAKLAFQRTLGCRSIAVSPQGGSIAAWSGDTLRMVDAKTGDDVWMAPEKFECRSCDFSTDGRWFAAGCADCSIRIWDAASGREVVKRELPHGKSFPSVRFLPKTATLVSNGVDSTIRFWDVEAGKEIRTLAARWGDVIPSPDGSRLCLVGSSAGGISLLDAATGEERPKLTGHQYSVRSIAFSPDGSLLATAASNDRTMRLWDLASGRQLREFTGFYDNVRFTPDGAWLVASQSYQFNVFEVSAGKSHPLLEKVDRAGAMLSPDGKLLLGNLAWMVGEPPKFSYTHEVRAWDMPERRQRWQLKDTQIGSLSFDASASRMAGMRIEPGNAYRRTAVVWDTQRFEELVAVPGVEPERDPRSFRRTMLEQVLMSPDGTRLVLFEGDSPARIVEVPSGKVLRTIDELKRSPFYHARFAPDGKRLVVGQSAVTSWDIETGQRDLVFEPPARTWEISPSGKLLATAAQDGTLRLYEFASGKVLAEMSLTGAGVASLEFSPDNRTLATGLGDGTVLIWPVDPPRWPSPVPESKPVESLDVLWGRLASEAETAYPTITKLVEQGEGAVAMLRERLEAEPTDTEQLKAWIAALATTSGAERGKAVAGLTALGSAAAPALRRAQETGLAEVAKAAISDLLAALDSPVIKSPGDLRRHRAIQVLQRIGSPGAQSLLEKLQRSSPSPREVREAEAALQRIAAAKESKP